jgi:hypothetical protein
MHLHDKLQFIYSVNDSSLQLTHSSSWLVLAGKESKRLHLANHGGKLQYRMRHTLRKLETIEFCQRFYRNTSTAENKRGSVT